MSHALVQDGYLWHDVRNRGRQAGNPRGFWRADFASWKAAIAGDAVRHIAADLTIVMNTPAVSASFLLVRIRDLLASQGTTASKSYSNGSS